MLNRIGRLVVVATFAAIGALCCGAAVKAAIVKHAFGAQQKIWTASSTGENLTSSTTLVGLPGANVTITIPPGKSQLVVARFTAESQCIGATPGDWCVVSILAENTEMEPAAGTDYGFDTAPTGGRAYWRGHAVDRSLVLQSGTYKIRVMYGVTINTTTFELDDWHLTVTTYLPAS
jgi:hypothetical protein